MNTPARPSTAGVLGDVLIARRSRGVCGVCGVTPTPATVDGVAPIVCEPCRVRAASDAASARPKRRRSAPALPLFD